MKTKKYYDKKNAGHKKNGKYIEEGIDENGIPYVRHFGPRQKFKPIPVPRYYESREEMNTLLLEEAKELIREKYPKLLKAPFSNKKLPLFGEAITDIKENILPQGYFMTRYFDEVEKLEEDLTGMEINGHQITKEMALELIEKQRKKILSFADDEKIPDHLKELLWITALEGLKTTKHFIKNLSDFKFKPHELRKWFGSYK